MSGKQRTVVEWSPHDAALFAVGADNLRLFEISTSSSSSSSSAASAAAEELTTQRKRSFRVVKINSKVAQLKCMEWYPFEAKPLLIAAGTGSGKVVLSDFADARARSAREFLPKYSRPCHAVAWNRAAPNQLAAGFEKVRSDFCTLVWDLNAVSGVAGGVPNGAGADQGGNSGGVSGPAMDSLSDGEGGMDSTMGSRKSVMSAGAGVGGAGVVSVGVGSGSALSGASTKPVHELSNSEATLALSWVPLQPTCLATGTGFKWLRIYDLRTKSTPLSVVAHNKAVLGVTFDEHRPNILATFSDSPQEPVKVWDIRQLEASNSPLLTIQQTSKNLSQVSWCPSKPGILVTSSAEEKWISLWDISTHESGGSNVLRKPFRRRYTSEALTSFSWQNLESRNPPRRSALSAPKSQVTAAAFPNRLLTSSVSGEIEDISVHDSMPVTVSSTGAIAFSCGKLLFGGAPSGPGLGTATSSRLALEADLGMFSTTDDDVASQMYKLAKNGYSIVLSKNLKLFTSRTSRQRQLRQLWLWVDQVEALRRIQTSRLAQAKAAGNTSGFASIANAGPLRGWPFDPEVLFNVGVKNMLTASSSGDTFGSNGETDAEDGQSPRPPMKIVSMMKTDPVLGCQFFEGLGRRLSQLACNWDPDCGQGSSRTSSSGAGQGFENSSNRGNYSIHKSNSGIWNPQKQPYEESPSQRSWSENGRYELANILNRCELDGMYARAAAIAVFHGDLNSAVSYLQKGAMWMTQSQHLNIGIKAPYSADVLQLVAMAVAGYSSSTVSPAGQSLWLGMCQQLLKRDEITSSDQPRYLHAILAFLCSASASATSNTNPRASQPQPARRGNPRRQWGSVDNLSVMSSSKPANAGSYSSILTDSTLPLGDRVAFACRYLPEDDLRSYIMQLEDESVRFGRLEGLVITGLNSAGLQLLQKYVDSTGDIQTLALLAARLPSALVARTPPMDKWIQIYKDLLNRWQLFHERARFDVGRFQLEDLLNGFASFSRDPEAEDLSAELSTPSTASVPPQLFVRCNFCNTTLSLASLLRLGGSHSSWLNRTKPKLSCCPTCRKPLPQCALCLLPFGSLNPYFELAHRRSKQTADAVNSLVSTAGDSGSVLKDPKSGKSEYENLAQLSSIPFVEWFTWCQSCKHGGHAHHIAEWFAAHSVCPVTDCDCSCQFLDSPIMLHEKQNERLAQQQRAAAAAATAAATASAAKAAQRQTSTSKRQQQQQQLVEGATSLRGAKAFNQSSFPGGHPHLSTSASIGPSAPPGYRMASSGLLRPSTASSSGLPPFSLSGSASSSMLNMGTNSTISANVGVAVGSSSGPGSKESTLTMSRTLGNKLDQLEKDGSYMQFM